MGILIGILVGIAIIALLKMLEKNNKGASVIVDNSTPGGSGSNGQCREYINNTGSAASDINYIDCSGTTHTNVVVEPNQSICIQSGTLHGGDSAFLIELGNC